MRTRPHTSSSDLRLAIACLPRHTREAMLTGIVSNPIIVGAYATGDGICPMLAAHRDGGRTNFIGFANAWDRFASRDGKRDRIRRATARELRVLRAHLEASLLDDDAPLSDLGAARAEHDGLVRARERGEAIARKRAERAAPHPREDAGERVNMRNREREARRGQPGDRDRRSELDSRPGWSWSRLVRRYDDYTRLLDHLDHSTHPDHSDPLGHSAPIDHGSTQVADCQPMPAGPHPRR
jgi:hypothetical protein